jgi:PAS domain S-box-containing protein
MQARAPKPEKPTRALRIPLWDEYGQAERFAGVLALAAALAAIPYLYAERLIVAELCLAMAIALIALCVASARFGHAAVLGMGTPLVMTIGAAALLAVTGGTCVASAAVLALAPAVAALWGGSPRAGWAFLGASIAISLAVVGLAPGEVETGAEPWVADARAPWIVAPLATALFALGRSWAIAHGAWQDDVFASHAVLAASEARFRSYVENAHDVTAELDARGNLLFITTSQEARYAAPVSRILGTRARDYVHPGDLAAVRACFADAAKGHARVSPRIRYRSAREEWRWLRVAVSSFRTASGELRFLLQARDETAQQREQEQLEQRVAELEQQVRRAAALLSPRPNEREGDPTPAA